MAGYVFSVVACIVAALFIDKIFWIVLIALVLQAVIRYIVFDAFFDRLSWKLLWSRFYDERTEKSTEHQLLKKLENDPSPETRQKLADYIKNKES